MGLNLALSGLPMMVHLGRFKSMRVELANCCSLVIWGCRFWILLVIKAKSFAYVVVGRF